MKHQLKSVENQVIVITGASSGIGLATALEAASRGARVVLTSRNEEDLRSISEKIQSQGGQAAYIVADVGNDSEVQKVADFAFQKFGGFDTWVNNAGVTVYGRLVDVPISEKKRVFDTNFWGVVHGCKAAVRHLRERGGAIINIGSETSEHTIPLQGIYSASKHAVKAYTDCLRMELEKENAPISVTLIKPAAIDTPFTAHARSHMERDPELPPPVYAPEVVARAILACAEKPTPSLFVGGSGVAIAALDKFFPRLAQRIGELVFFEKQKARKPVHRDEGLMRKPEHEGEVYGDSPYRVRRSSFYSQGALHPLASALIVGGIGTVLVRSLRRIQSRRVVSEEIPSYSRQQERKAA